MNWLLCFPAAPSPTRPSSPPPRKCGHTRLLDHDHARLAIAPAGHHHTTTAAPLTKAPNSGVPGTRGPRAPRHPGALSRPAGHATCVCEPFDREPVPDPCTHSHLLYNTGFRSHNVYILFAPEPFSAWAAVVCNPALCRGGWSLVDAHTAFACLECRMEAPIGQPAAC